MATNQTDTTRANNREETIDERGARLALERKALRPGSANDSLRERLLGLLSCNMYGDFDGGQATSHDRVLLRFASATSKAVALALQGATYVNSNEQFDADFTTDEAATVLYGLSSLLEYGPDLIQDLREATLKEVRQ